MRHFLMFSLSAVALSFACSTRAAVLDFEDFESYAPGPLVPGAADWTVVAGQEANLTVETGGINYINGELSSEGGSRALRVGPNLPSATTNNVADWSFATTSLDTVWFSFLLRTSENASSPASVDPTRDFFQIHFSDATAEQAQSLSMVLDNINGTVDHNFRARSGSSGATTGMTDFSGTVLNQPLQPNLIVGRVEKVATDFETVSIFANPATLSVPATPTAMATFDGVEIIDLATMSVRISGLESDDTYFLDQVVIGETYQDVVDCASSSALNCFVPADFNGDGDVNDADYDILAGNLFEGTTHAQGDYDGSGLTDLDDFVLFRADFNAANPGGSAVPEPSALAMLTVASGLLMTLAKVRPARRLS